ncbi:MAG: hypothetical protein ACYCOR_14495 [Acidobacteriaceae bacterium]
MNERLFLLAAMKSGSNASVVVPFTAVYPMAVCLIAPFVLREHITLVQGGGVLCGLGAIFLLAGLMAGEVTPGRAASGSTPPIGWLRSI